jgi:hypothetical protein
LQFDQRDIYDAYLGITSDEPLLRSSAVEFVDNLVDWRTSRFIVPLLDDPKGLRAATLGPQLHHLHLQDWPDALAYLLEANDPRLNVLALEAMGKDVPSSLRALQRAVSDYASERVEEA